jgi:hypothetical protein
MSLSLMLGCILTHIIETRLAALMLLKTCEVGASVIVLIQSCDCLVCLAT